MKRIISALLAAAMMILPLAAGFDGILPDAKAADIDYSCGENATWYLDTETGVLTVTGTGETYSYGGGEAPWYNYASYIKSVVISEGITQINGAFFYKLTKIKSLTFPASLERINSSWSFPALETINIPEDSKLYWINVNTFGSDSVWYNNLPDCSVVKVGGVVLGFKGTPSSGISVEIPVGVKTICKDAFKGVENIKEITFPDTVEYVGEAAFEGTGWYDSLPTGLVYIGKTLYSYKGTMPLSEKDVVVKDGTVSVTDKAFYENGIINSISFPASLKEIGAGSFNDCENLKQVTFAENSKLKTLGERSFYNCTFESFDFPESLETIGTNAFSHTKLRAVYIPSEVKQFDGAFNSCSAVRRYEVSPENPYFCSDEDGVLFSKDKTVLYYAPAYMDKLEYTVPSDVLYIGQYAFSGSQLKKVTFNDELESTGENVFDRCYIDIIDLGDGLPQLDESILYDNWSTKRLTITENINTIEKDALGYHLDYVYFPNKDVEIVRSIVLQSDTKFFCYADSTAYNYAVKYGVKYVLFDDNNKGDYSELEEAVKKANALSPTRKTHFAYWEIMAVVENMPLNISKSYQSEIDAMTDAINEGFSDMGVIWSDYSAVDEAIAKANAVNRNIYTAESLARLDAAVNAVERHGDVADNELIKEYVENIEKALRNLENKPGDFSELTSVIEEAESVDRSLYTEESLKKLDEAVGAADFDLQGVRQEQIDSWRDAIKDALGELEYKDADYSVLDSLKEQADGIDRSLYTPESLAKLDEALASVDYDLTIDKQSQVNEWAKAIENAIKGLEYKDADYSAIDSLKEQADGIDRSLYTPESLAKLDEALASVDYDLTIDKQSQVGEWADAIEKAIAELKFKPADYSAVEAEKAKADKLDMRYYSEVSRLVLNNAINAVDYNLNITEQARVDAYAKAIADAIGKLEYASAVLRHDLCGVIVSATTKEIKPDTVLAVEKVDSSEHEGTNFAVGGSIRSLHFYDINLVLENKTVQPEGTVTVKIKLAEGVNPAKCKVYHVTDDIVNPLVRYSSTIDGNYIVFETDHFSEFAVIEVETVVESIEVSSFPSKTVYGIGEKIDLSGMTVIAHFSDGTSKAVDGYDVGTADTSSIGTKKVTVYYTFASITKTDEFEITVVADKTSVEITSDGKPTESVNKKVGIFSFYSKASIALGYSAENADGLSVRWSSDNSKVMVDSNGKVTCKGLFGAKKATITIEIVDRGGNIVATDKVTVIFYKLSFQLSRLQALSADAAGRKGYTLLLV